MTSALSPRRLLPLVASVAIVAFAVHVLHGTLQRIDFADVVVQFRAIPATSLVLGGVLVAVLFATLASYEAIAVRWVGGPVSARRAALTALIAAPIGHAVGWGALSGGAVRYRMYAAVGMRPLDVGKVVLLAAMPYAAALGLLLGASLVLRSAEAAALLRVPESVARGSGLGLLALHAAYVTTVLLRRRPLALGRMSLTLPPPPLTAVQYAIGTIEVCVAAGILYVLLPEGLDLPFLAFVGVYVLAILAGLASSVPAGLGVFESMLLVLLPQVPPDRLLGAALAYRILLAVIPLCVALALLAVHEGWARLPAQRRAAEARAAAARRHEAEELEAAAARRRATERAGW